MVVQGESVVQDVEMENVENTSDDTEIKKDSNVVTIQEIREQIRQIEKAVSSKEPR